MTRSEHIAWAKSRAMECAVKGDSAGALGSIAIDLMKHEETRNHPAPMLGMTLKLANCLETIPEIVSFIEGIN